MSGILKGERGWRTYTQAVFTLSVCVSAPLLSVLDRSELRGEDVESLLEGDALLAEFVVGREASGMSAACRTSALAHLLQHRHKTGRRRKKESEEESRVEVVGLCKLLLVAECQQQGP
jgi:hypothetical protein